MFRLAGVFEWPGFSSELMALGFWRLWSKVLCTFGFRAFGVYRGLGVYGFRAFGVYRGLGV